MANTDTRILDRCSLPSAICGVEVIARNGIGQVDNEMVLVAIRRCPERIDIVMRFQ